MARIIRSPDALADAAEIWAYIAENNVAAADRVLESFDKKLHLLVEQPGLGQLREELGPGVRSLVVGNYLLFYRAAAEHIELIRILHGARDLRRIFGR